jgi:hypothetical protein
VFDGDFDGDGFHEVIIYYEGDGNWWLRKFEDTSQTLEYYKSKCLETYRKY